ncbi:putative exosome complex component rrp40 [Rhopilema esculentum]|uniref:putative exosome complex component rrp40 n=1 Tax=Rhopilema esculentum TaxID=499914 RepID=UPI0031DD46BA|eukprot:gene4957-21302_t
MEEKVNTVVLPGDVIYELEATSDDKEAFRFGPGIREESGKIMSSKAGVLRTKEPNILWIDSNQRRYVPARNDKVVGIITKTGKESYKVDIGSSCTAGLGNLSFEGATKRNKPNLQIGDLVYARLSMVNKDMEPELTCMDTTGKSNGLGQLNGGFLIKVSLRLARKLLRPDHIVLALLGRHFPFEVTVGLNGRIWINSKGILNTIAVANAITNSEFLGDKEIKTMVDKIVNELRKS